ncbi:MAG: hypothetical protein LUB61_05700 [Eggerthellaceae bacterium]|nr:hypothetical protein [Eggerthellaceae bacterium]
MPTPRPSMTLLLDIDERIASKKTKDELNRCFAAVGTSLVRTHASDSDEAPVINRIKMLPRMGTKKYLYSKDTVSDELGEGEALQKWLYNEFGKIGNNILIINRRQREIGLPEVSFQWIDVDLQNGACTLHMHLNSIGSILAGDAEMIGDVRDALNDGTIASDPSTVKSILMPTPESWAAQCEQGAIVAEKRREEEEKKKKEQAEEEKRKKKKEQKFAEQSFLEAPDLVAAAKEADMAKKIAEDNARMAAIQKKLNEKKRDKAAAENASIQQDPGDLDVTVTDEEIEEAQAQSEEQRQKTLSYYKPKMTPEEYAHQFDLPSADFDVDYSQWVVTFSDGSTKVYNYAEKDFVSEEEE